MPATIPENYDRELGGRLEKLTIDQNIRDSDGIGLYTTSTGENLSVYVSNAGNFVGKEVLVKFAFRNKEGGPGVDRIANFITSDVPEGFEGLSSANHFFYGILPQKLQDPQEIPSYDNILEYFNPGSLPWMMYFRKGHSKSKGRFAIDFHDQVQSKKKKSLRELFNRELPKPEIASRLIVADTHQCLETVIAMAADMGIKGIEMEPLK